nr:uracil-DNA glycosylase [Candidatus Sigynarchaeum springense]
MILDDIWQYIKQVVFTVPSSERLFNLYREVNLSFDRETANEIRQQNLMSYFSSFTERPTILIVGEAPGPKGCRFPGVPFTSESQLCRHILPFSGEQSSLNGPYSEITANVFWKAITQYHSKIFVWNCIPFHPHNPGDFLSIRAPTNEEISRFSKILSEIYLKLKPERIIAIGKKSASLLSKLDIKFTYIRHPSHGGIEAFNEGISSFFRNLNTTK